MERKAVKNCIAVAFWLVVWHIGAALVNRSLLIPVPTPVDTVAALCRFAARGSFWLTVGASLLRITAGFLAALLAGVACAVADAKWDVFHTLTAPLLALIRAIPVASFTILVFLWVSRGSIPSVISFFTVLPIVWVTVSDGIRAADRHLVEMARVFGMRGGDILRKITLPEIKPFFRTAVASGLGFAWKSGVAAEVICRSQTSLGNLLWEGKSSVSYDEVFAVTLVIVLLSGVLQWVARRILKGGEGT